ncbi:MAG: 50S ribosomal protein L35ae [Conexivisphaera sp.]
MRAVIVGYRRGPGKVYQGVSLVRVLDWDGSTDLTGWSVRAEDPHGNAYEGRVVGRHGGNNVFRVRFTPNLPGQMIGRTAEVIPPAAQPTSSA